MSEPYKFGDHVKVIATEDGRVYDGTGVPYQQELSGKKGVVLFEDELWASVQVELEDGTKTDISVECIERNRRTFEEIVNELVEETRENGRFLFEGITAGLASWTDGTNRFWIDREGRLTARSLEAGIVLLTAQDLSMFNAACQEIAANYAAEHGKEEAR